jgi:hypothetical protein
MSTIKIYKDKIKIDTIDRVLQKMSCVWIFVLLIYAVVLFLMKDIESTLDKLNILFQYVSVKVAEISF